MSSDCRPWMASYRSASARIAARVPTRVFRWKRGGPGHHNDPRVRHAARRDKMGADRDGATAAARLSVEASGRSLGPCDCPRQHDLRQEVAWPAPEPIDMAWLHEAIARESSKASPSQPSSSAPRMSCPYVGCAHRARLRSARRTCWLRAWPRHARPASRGDRPPGEPGPIRCKRR